MHFRQTGQPDQPCRLLRALVVEVEEDVVLPPGRLGGHVGDQDLPSAGVVSLLTPPFFVLLAPSPLPGGGAATDVGGGAAVVLAIVLAWLMVPSTAT